MLTTRCSDAFTKREKAAEEMYIKEEERKKYVSSPPPRVPLANPCRLLELKDKLKVQKEHIEKMQTDM